MVHFTTHILGLIVIPMVLNLQGCGKGGNSQTTTTTTTAAHTSFPDKPCPASMQSLIRERAEYWVNKTNLSIALGYSGPDGSGNLCNMGHVAHALKLSKPGVAGNFIYGSFTKVWTASAVLKLHEAGLLNLDEPAFPHMEPAYANATGGGSLVSPFGADIQKVTIRELLSMRGSLKDYDEIDYQLQHLTDDLGPSQSAKMFGAMLPGTPLGTCGLYSSMSYVLLGLVLIGQNKTAWDKYDQNVWREFFPDIHFALHGKCSDYVDIRDAQCMGCKNVNVMDMSCTNGFTCGNMIAAPKDVSRFLWYLFEGHLIGSSTLQQMLTFKPLSSDSGANTACHGFCDGCGYGLGVQEQAFGTPLPGHAGQTYGFTTISAFDKDQQAAYVAGVASGNRGADDIWRDLRNRIATHHSTMESLLV